MEPGELCRITVTEGSQVGDINMWNRDNPAEHFYCGKTRQFHAAHLTTYDRLWSNLPKLRAMATVVRGMYLEFYLYNRYIIFNHKPYTRFTLSRPILFY